MSLDTHDTTRIVHVPDHRDRAKAALMAQFRSAPRLAALAESVGQAVQVVEDIAFGYLFGMLLPFAIGDQLDMWGARVGEGREGLDDRNYRRFINARILVNHSRGRWDELIVLWRMLTAPGDIATYTMHPAGCSFYVLRHEPLEAVMIRKIRSLMDDVKPAGVAVELVELLVGHFGWPTDPGSEPLDVGIFGRAF